MNSIPQPIEEMQLLVSFNKPFSKKWAIEELKELYHTRKEILTMLLEIKETCSFAVVAEINQAIATVNLFLLSLQLGLSFYENTQSDVYYAGYKIIYKNQPLTFIIANQGFLEKHIHLNLKDLANHLEHYIKNNSIPMAELLPDREKTNKEAINKKALQLNFTTAKRSKEKNS